MLIREMMVALDQNKEKDKECRSIKLHACTQVGTSQWCLTRRLISRSSFSCKAGCFSGSMPLALCVCNRRKNRQEAARSKDVGDVSSDSEIFH